jgi:hypothetical protein
VRSLLAVLLGVGVAAACVAGTTCPCGEAFDRDPLNPDEVLAIGTSHDASIHCYCRCGDDPEERFPPSLACAGFEGPCEASSGRWTERTCR